MVTKLQEVTKFCNRGKVQPERVLGIKLQSYKKIAKRDKI